MILISGSDQAMKSDVIAVSQQTGQLPVKLVGHAGTQTSEPGEAMETLVVDRFGDSCVTSGSEYHGAVSYREDLPTKPQVKGPLLHVSGAGVGDGVQLDAGSAKDGSISTRLNSSNTCSSSAVAQVSSLIAISPAIPHNAGDDQEDKENHVQVT
ncbi:hypothetical protein RRG08_034095 [Elysia crispata]|uniref:Uncharacterized protein n=1 Tax=Elysia crispata TaxID=231223 RepID=A0AAE0YSU9_9GAST|nr:hypothetical protein RRG08_034095 [Elysia crispata]